MGHTTCPSVDERFWAKVDKSGDCWLWTGGRYVIGYGKFWLDGRDAYAHRVAYELTHGAIPEGMLIDHRCRELLCVNPDHLRLATRKQNAENINGPRSDNTSGFTGVVWNRHIQKWQAVVHHHGKRHYLGSFCDANEAGESARRKRIELFTYNEVDRRMV